MLRYPAFVFCVAAAVGCSDNKSQQADQGDAGPAEPWWHFEPINHGVGDVTLTDVWGRRDGAIFVVGWYGTIFTNRVSPANPYGGWVSMPSPTDEHLTGIYGVENGGQFGQANNLDGEMFAVGWNGTLLYFNPNPDPAGNPSPTPDDGRWQVIADPSQSFLPKLKVDPACPDYDGDGVPDDGGDPFGGPPDGWWSADATCTGSSDTTCDDNCRTSPNGTLRPLADSNADGCPDSPSGDPGQVDGDSDGIGESCDANDTAADAPGRLTPTLFDVWAEADGVNTTVIAVGERGALVAYQGPNGAQVVTSPALPITDRASWTAQEHLPFRLVNDCDEASTPPGNNCEDSNSPGLLPPSCPAQCNPLRTICECLPDSGDACCQLGNKTCCVAGTQYTSGAADGCCQTGGEAACSAQLGQGECGEKCPGCFRRHDKTLRAVTVTGTGTIVAVGAHGTIMEAPVSDIFGVWSSPNCTLSAPPPLDAAPLFTAASGGQNTVHIVGAAGVVVTYDPSSGSVGTPCTPVPRCGAPPGFLAGVFTLDDGRSLIVGDAGMLLELDVGRVECGVDDNDDGEIRQPVMQLENKLHENLNAIWRTSVQGPNGVPIVRYWLVGASGLMVRAGYY